MYTYERAKRIAESYKRTGGEYAVVGYNGTYFVKKVKDLSKSNFEHIVYSTK